jgi:hypothetical protein
METEKQIQTQNPPILSLEKLPEEISEKNSKAIELLDSWINEDNEQEQKETWEYLKKELDKNRLSDRKFFS